MTTHMGWEEGRDLALLRIRNGVCWGCGIGTEHATMSSFGGLCGGCYGRYKRSVPKFEDKWSGDEVGPLAWAYKLRRRHLAGDLLTKTQIEMYQSILKKTHTGEEHADV